MFSTLALKSAKFLFSSVRKIAQFVICGDGNGRFMHNILIMQEKQSIVAAGAGASTKVVLPYEIPAPGSKNGRMTNLIRIENVRDVGEYISRIDEMIERKGEWLWH